MIRTKRPLNNDVDMTLRMPSGVLNAGSPPDFPALVMALMTLTRGMASAARARP